jgi:hypothetical protein
MRFSGLTMVALAVSLMCVGVAPASAAFELTLSDGTNSVTVNSLTGCSSTFAGNDCDAPNVAITAPGTATFIGSLGSGTFTFNSTTGITKPITVDPLLMDTVTLNIASAGAGTLTITWSDQDWTWPGGYILDAGGTLTAPAGSTVLYEAFLNNANVLSATTTEIGELGPFGPGAFAGNLSSGVVASATPYSLTQRLTLTFTGSGTVSGDFALIAVPEPASVALLGGVLLVTCAALKRKFRRAA